LRHGLLRFARNDEGGAPASVVFLHGVPPDWQAFGRHGANRTAPGHPVTLSCYRLQGNKALFTGQALAAPRYSGRDKAADTMDNICESET
jgi:hypothetical protein